MVKHFVVTMLLSLGLSIAQGQGMSNSKINVGQKAPDIEYPGVNGKPVKLSTVAKNRVVLLDFWASWCRPCRAANPGLVKMYDKYKGKKFKKAAKGFTIVSVSLDKSKEAWEKAIADDKLSWEYHMSDLGFWNSKPAATYGVEYIPQAFLVGADGKIIGKYNFAEEADKDLEKLLAH